MQISKEMNGLWKHSLAGNPLARNMKIDGNTLDCDYYFHATVLLLHRTSEFILLWCEMKFAPDWSSRKLLGCPSAWFSAVSMKFATNWSSRKLLGCPSAWFSAVSVYWQNHKVSLPCLELSRRSRETKSVFFFVPGNEKTGGGPIYRKTVTKRIKKANVIGSLCNISMWLTNPHMSLMTNELDLECMNQ